MKKAIKCTCFVLIFIAVLTYVSSVISFKGEGSAYTMTQFYRQDEDSIDVLVLGSSHAYVDINPAVLWKEYGIAAYDMGGSIQPMWSSYHYLVEALKTQHPRLIILEGYCLFPRDMYERLVIIANNYGLKWSHNRLDALKASTQTWEYMDYLLTFNQTHNRYNDLSEEDFRSGKGDPLSGSWKGYVNTTSIASFDRPDVTDITESTDLDPKIETYYRKILALAQKSNIPIAVVISPYANITDESQAVYNRGAEIADEYGVNFYNFNLDYDICNLDFSTDCAEDGSHLNYLGATKYTKALGDILIQDYPDQYVDRRGDDRYASWDLNSTYYDRTIYNLQISRAENIPAAISLASDDNYTILLSISQENEDSAALCAALSENGIELGATTGAWLINGSSQTAENLRDFPWHSEPVKYDDLLVTHTGTDYQFILDGTDYNAVESGTNLLIYDKMTASVVTTIGF